VVFCPLQEGSAALRNVPISTANFNRNQLSRPSFSQVLEDVLRDGGHSVRLTRTPSPENEAVKRYRRVYLQKGVQRYVTFLFWVCLS